MYLPYSETQRFSPLFLDYLSESPALKAFYRYPFDKTGLERSIEDIQLYDYNRSLLCETLEQQYQPLSRSQSVADNIAALRDTNTFVVVAAHQPNLLTGPLYFVYKIVSAIKLAAHLQVTYPSFRFVPIYLMGSEDHDFAEINHFNLYGKTLTWESTKGGAVGRFSTETLAPLFDELSLILGNDTAAMDLMTLLKQCYLDNPTLADATRAWVNHLFGQYGLVVVNPDDKNFKKEVFGKIANTEINHKMANGRHLSYHFVHETDRHLNDAGYNSQAFPRAVNLFYLTHNDRERIEPQGEGLFKTHTDSKHWTLDEINEELAEYPDRFSPNVILRPVYQQALLPAVAWVGGGGELAYWLQLKSTFEAYKVHYPVLVPRNSALWVNENIAQKMKQLSLEINDLFEETDKIVANYVRNHSEHELNLSPQKQDLRTIFEQILLHAQQIDPTLQATVIAEMTKLDKSIDMLEMKLLRAEKRNFETTIAQIRNIKDKLFPNGSLQERHENMLPYYLKYGNQFIQLLLDKFNPLDKMFTVIFH